MPGVEQPKIQNEARGNADPKIQERDRAQKWEVRKYAVERPEAGASGSKVIQFREQTTPASPG